MANIVAFRYTETYQPLLGGTAIPVKRINFSDEMHVYSNLYKGYTTVLFCGIKKWDDAEFTLYYYVKWYATEDLRLSWDDNCYVIYDGVKYTTVEKLYAAIENRKNLAILDNYL